MVPLKLTIFQPYSWLTVIVALALLALAIWRMEPAQSLAPDPAVFEDEDQPEVKAESTKTFAEWLENLWILNVLVFAAGIAIPRRWSALVKPGCQRPAGFQYVAFGDRTGALGVVIGDRLDQFVVLIEGVLFVFGEEG